MNGCVFVVDDDISIRQSLELLISSAGWQPRTCASAQEFLACPRVLAPSCLVLDVTLPDINGLELQRLIADRVEMPVVFITGNIDVPTTVRAMKAGAFEFLTKPFSGETLVSAIRQALERSQAALAQAADWLTLKKRYASLSHREREVLSLIVSGRLNKQVGGELGITENTVKAHRSKVMRKMRADSLPELVKMVGRLEPRRLGGATGPG